MAITLREQVLLAAVENEAVLLQTDSTPYFSLHGTAWRMLQSLTDDSTVEAARATLLSDFDTADSRLTRDRSALIDQPGARDLIAQDAA